MMKGKVKAVSPVTEMAVIIESEPKFSLYKVRVLGYQVHWGRRARFHPN